MTITFMGNEMASFTPSDSTVLESAGTLNGYTPYESGFQRCAVQNTDINSIVSYFETAPLGSMTSAWIHFRFMNLGAGGGEQKTIYVKNAGGTEVFKIVEYSNGVSNFWKAYYWDGAAWQVGGSDFTFTVGAPNDIDIQLTASTYAIYVAGTLRDSGVANIATIETVGFIYAKTTISGVIIATEPTIGWLLACYAPDGNGANTAWTGDYTLVDEVVYDDADVISSGSVDQVETYTKAGLDFTGYAVRAVGVAARARRGASGPANLQGVLRVSGADYPSSSKLLTTGYTPNVYIWETNPATAAAWSAAAVPALEFGLKSKT